MRHLTLTCLVILLFAVIGVHYYLVREGFKASKSSDSSGNDITDTDTDTDTEASKTSNANMNTLSAESGDEMSEMTPIATAKQKQAGLLKDIRQIVHSEIAKLRLSKPVLPSAEHTSPSSISTRQGQEYMSAGCPTDMSQYIRKNEIPCWGCTLPQ